MLQQLRPHLYKLTPAAPPPPAQTHSSSPAPSVQTHSSSPAPTCTNSLQQPRPHMHKLTPAAPPPSAQTHSSSPAPICTNSLQQPHTHNTHSRTLTHIHSPAVKGVDICDVTEHIISLPPQPCWKSHYLWAHLVIVALEKKQSRHAQ